MAAAKDIDHLPKNDANYTALTPLWFLERAAAVHPNRPSLVHGPLTYTWLDTYIRCRRLASALSNHRFGPGSTLILEFLCAETVVNCVNIRLNAATIAFLLGHSASTVLMVDQDFFTLAEESLKILAEKGEKKFKPPLLIVIPDETCDPKSLEYALGKGAINYEKFLEMGDPDFAWKPPEDEWQSIALGYTSGTTALVPRGSDLSVDSTHVSLQWLVLYLGVGSPLWNQYMPPAGICQGGILGNSQVWCHSLLLPLLLSLNNHRQCHPQKKLSFLSLMSST
ncbi:hypothetical protein MLD38_017962 [Melastoma candidum]|uniref:Uncharacterized protein n=1 Tax=Melastoma candidum TaxID=119954 RepID=A0ACB9QSD0_9MYRT|nr:hypothetical protein MLD38_017962 [Melastoma candidum]